jgi:hypothetical protein
MGVREYDPALGRFISLDPLKGEPTEPQQRNRYPYVGNNPMMRYDLNGMTSSAVEELWGVFWGIPESVAACAAGAPVCAAGAIAVGTAIAGYGGYEAYEQGGGYSERFEVSAATLNFPKTAK